MPVGKLNRLDGRGLGFGLLENVQIGFCEAAAFTRLVARPN